MNKLEKFLLCTNGALYGLVLIFSYAYVDLNLTLSQNPAILAFIKLMQQLGYYHRPEATALYLQWIAIAFTFFIFNLFLFKRNKLSARYLKITTIANTAILIFAYPFLSSDIFNYMFDAKIIFIHHANPYTHKPLDFPTDEWLRFMRWTHRYSPYGPLWLLLSLIPTALSFGKFILGLLLFKAFIGTCHLINTYLVLKILEKINPKRALYGSAFYALNPLFLIEGIANAHNDIVVLSFVLVSIYFLVFQKKILSTIAIFLGTAIKYIPILTLTWLVWKGFKKEKDIPSLALLNTLTMLIFTFVYSSFGIKVPFVSSGATQVQFQPWYLLWSLPYVSLIPHKDLVTVAIALCIGASLRYLPYLYYGTWSEPFTTQYMTIVTLTPAILSASVIILLKTFKPKKSP